MSIIRKDKNVTASALLAVAVILMVLGGLDWILHGGLAVKYSVIDLFITFSGPCYLVLGIVARRHRLPPALIGSGLYGYMALQDLELLVFHIPIMILLLMAVVSALKHSAAKNKV